VSDAERGALVIALGVCIGIFLILRSLVLWYWKINTVVQLLDKQNALLAKLVEQGDPERKTRCSDCHGVIEPGARKCPHCGAEFDRIQSSTVNHSHATRVDCANCGKPVDWNGKGVVKCVACGRVQLPVP
jgi:endogenous inhibitor of DNA gyrase (YacG/DUF329 family)